MSILKLSIFLLSSCLVLGELSPEQNACVSSILVRDQPFCRVNDTVTQIYPSSEAYCTDITVTVYDSLQYFKVAPFITCVDDYSSCYDLELLTQGKNEHIVKNITVNGTVTACAMPVGEDCYRVAADNDNYSSTFSDNVNDQFNEQMPACCLKECESMNSIVGTR